jgi:DNA-directed RNA polymerase specialized sigma24 family protein
METGSDEGFRSGLVAPVGPLRGFARSPCPGGTSRANDLPEDALARAGRHRANFRLGSNQKAYHVATPP